MTSRSPYTLAHALAATAVLLATVFSQGVPAFWRAFVHGLGGQLTPQMLLTNFLATIALFGTLALALWGSTRLARRLRPAAAPEPPPVPAPARLAAMGLAARWSPLVIAAALGLNALGAAGIEWATGVQPSDQELVKCFAGDACPWGIRLCLGALVLFEAPLLEEPLFRGILYRGFASAMPGPAATALSGFLFALVHVNAASFLPLWFLGCVFATLYRRTGTLLAPMTAHALFNAANLALLPFLPA